MDWSVIKPDVFGTIMDFFATGLPVLDQDAEPSPDTSMQRKSSFVYFLTSIGMIICSITKQLDLNKGQSK